MLEKCSRCLIYNTSKFQITSPQFTKDSPPKTLYIVSVASSLLEVCILKNPLSISSDFVTLCCGILTIETLHSFLQSFCFTGQNGAFSTTEQNHYLLIMDFSKYRLLTATKVTETMYRVFGGRILCQQMREQST